MPDELEKLKIELDQINLGINGKNNSSIKWQRQPWRQEPDVLIDNIAFRYMVV